MISRSTLIGALVVAELGIVGMAARSIAGDSVRLGPSFAFHGHGHGRSGNDGVSAPPRIDKSIVAGPAPHVQIDVHNIDLVIEARPQPLVHAVEGLHVSGWSYGTLPPIAMDRTADGVRLTAPPDDVHIHLGDVTRTMHIDVPAGATVEILSCGHVDVTGLRTKFVAHTPLGNIHVRDHRGDVDVSTADGKIELVDVQAQDIAANTHDGRLYLTRVSADRIDAHSNYGRIYAVDVRAKDGALSTHSGRVSASFTGNSDAQVVASTRHGDVTVSGVASAEAGSRTREFQLGGGSGRFTVSTDEGDVNISQGANV